MCIDVEEVRDAVDHDALGRRFFSPAERDQLRQLPESARREAFFACWVAKEAVLKATGEGLSAGLGRFDMVVLADRRRWSPGDPGRRGHGPSWSGG